ncbi:hypothetical protein Q4R72_06720, partial [Morganella morganii]
SLSDKCKTVFFLHTVPHFSKISVFSRLFCLNRHVSCPDSDNLLSGFISSKLFNRKINNKTEINLYDWSDDA